MSICFYADLVVYFLAGFLLVVALKTPKKDASGEKPQKWTARAKIYLMGFVIGILFAAARFGMQKYFNRSTVCKVAATLEPVSIPKPLAEAVKEACAADS
jgi:hypothetical protein